MPTSARVEALDCGASPQLAACKDGRFGTLACQGESDTPRREDTMKHAIYGKLTTALAAAAFALVVGSVSLFSLDEVLESNARVGAVRDLLRAVERGRAAILAAESSERGYLITLEDSYLASYERARQESRDALGAARREALAPYAPRLDRFERLAAAIVDDLDATMRAAREADANGVRTLVRRSASRTSMAELETVVSDLRGDVETMLEVSLSERDRNVVATQVIVAVGTFLGFLFALMANMGLRRTLTLVERARETMEAQSEELSARNRALVAAARQEAMTVAKLEKSNLELDRFAYVASHDLKAPLRGIANLAGWLRDDLGDAAPEATRGHLDLLEGRVQRMEGLIDGILEYSRAGRATSPPVRVDTSTVVRESIELLAPPEGAVQVATELPAVETERVPFQQVWLNLIGNALKFSRLERGDAARVTVEHTSRDDHHEFVVGDNGPGIAPEYQERVFGIFQTLAPRDEVEGTGIGLAIVKKIVEAQGGRIWIESEEGKGARFHFTWPHARSPSEP